MKPFGGLNADDFAVYVPEKWSSNVHNLTRMRVKDAMLALCDAAQKDLKDELLGLSRAASDEIPNIVNHKKVEAQWVYWFRDQAAREALASFLEKTPLDGAVIFNIAPQDKHVILAVILSNTNLWVGLRLASGAHVDRKNLSAKLSKSWEREHFAEMLKDLPDGASLGFENSLLPSNEVHLATLEEQGGQLELSAPAWQLGHALPKEHVVELGKDLPDYVARWLGALAPFYRFVAWTRDNDHIEAGKKIQEEKAQKRRQATNYNAGDKVRIISGMFSGKMGTVQEIDTKAQIRVLVGKMSVVVSGTDVVPAN